MVRKVKIAQFKSRLSEYLKSVRRGNEVVIKDRDTPIARLVPYQASKDRLIVRPATKSLKDIEKVFASLTPPKKIKPGDVDEALRWTRRDAIDKGLA